jgi:hypothetical protein
VIDALSCLAARHRYGDARELGESEEQVRSYNQVDVLLDAVDASDA